MNNKQTKFDQRYLEMARIWAKNSYCTRRQVGALVVKNNMIISDGYNGTPSGFENVCEDDNNVTKPYVLHAEANAITKLARSSNNSEGATLYVTDSPCIECSKLIIPSLFSKGHASIMGLTSTSISPHPIAYTVTLISIPANALGNRSGKKASPMRPAAEQTSETTIDTL